MFEYLPERDRDTEWLSGIACGPTVLWSWWFVEVAVDVEELLSSCKGGIAFRFMLFLSTDRWDDIDADLRPWWMKGKFRSYSLTPLFFPPLVKNILLGLAYWAMEAQSGIQLVYYTTKSQQDDIVIYTTRSTYPSSMTRSSIAKSCCLRSWTSSLLCLLHCCTLFMSKVSISVNNKHTNLVTHTFFLHFRCFAFQCRILGP